MYLLLKTFMLQFSCLSQHSYKSSKIFKKEETHIQAHLSYCKTSVFVSGAEEIIARNDFELLVLQPPLSHTTKSNKSVNPVIFILFVTLHGTFNTIKDYFQTKE